MSKAIRHFDYISPVANRDGIDGIRAGQGVVTDHSCRCGNVDLGPYQIGDVDHKAFSKPLNKINETD